MKTTLIFSLLLAFSLSLFSVEKDSDSLEEFFGNRFALQPPSAQEEKDAADFVQNFFKRIEAKDLTEAYHLDTSPEFKSTMSYERFRIFIRDLDELDFSQKHEKFNVNFQTNDKNKATYSTLLKGKQPGERIYVDFSLKRDEEGNWKIMGIKIYDIYHSRT